MSDYDSAAAMAYERMVEPLTGSFAPALLDASGLGPIAGLDVLDAACGSGAVTLCAESQGAIVTACDLSAAMVDRCASRSPSTATAVADVKALPRVGLGDLIWPSQTLVSSSATTWWLG